MMQPGNPALPGANYMDGGVNFVVYSGGAEAVELCLFDENRNQIEGHFLPEQDGGVWHGFLPGCAAGQRYGYRVHGPWAPKEGLRYNPAKLLIDPYARRLDGAFQWSPAVFDFDPEAKKGKWKKSERDSAPFVPVCLVEAPGRRPRFRRPAIAWSDAIIYETNVRGYTMRHPDVPESERGKFKGLTNGQVLEYLKALGITSLELMPVQSFIDEKFLARRGQRNLWGYNSIQFFTPDIRFARCDGIAEFREMVNSIHEAGFEVILDVAYNHTGEGGRHGPTLSFRGLDNLAYYRTKPGKPGRYVNDTGCGNTLNADHPRVQNLVLNSLRYWHGDMGVDGFRFDLATVLGRKENGFRKSHELLTRIGSDPDLWGAKLIAEPWDPGPGGYQLGRFPVEWAEWNDRYRDTVRRFWRGDYDQAGDFARRIHGSADLFEPGGRNPSASINFVTSHDGFTLMDLVSYRHRHNQTNGECNQDGHAHNYSHNYGVEGESADADINWVRRRQRLNLLATLLFSQGTPMLLAGDEFGNGQAGNNNAFAQDNETGWVDWQRMGEDPEFTERVRKLINLRNDLRLLRQARYIHGRMPVEGGWCDIAWLHPDGRPMEANDWHAARQLTLLFSTHPDQKDSSPVVEVVAVLFNTSKEDTLFTLPADLPPDWEVQFFSSGKLAESPGNGCWNVPAQSLLLLTSHL